jgi:hypothetical protein
MFGWKKMELSCSGEAWVRTDSGVLIFKNTLVNVAEDGSYSKKAVYDVFKTGRQSRDGCFAELAQAQKFGETLKKGG